MKKQIVIVENGKEKVLQFTVRDKAHLESQIKYPHRVVKSKKVYNRKKVKKGIDIE